MEASQEEGTSEEVEEATLEEITPTISCHVLVGISTLQTPHIEGYIKNKNVTVLIDSGSSHNFIHCKLAKVLNCFVYPTLEFQTDELSIAHGNAIISILQWGNMY